MMLLKASLILTILTVCSALPPSLVQDNEATFGLRLLNELELENGGVQASKNLVVAPAGLKVLLAMLQAGAKGDTAAEIEDVIGTPTIDPPSKGAMRSNNLLAVQNDFSFTPEYIELLQSKFFATKHEVTYRTYVNIWATDDINKWISSKTGFNITKFYSDPYDLPYQCSLVAVNAEHFSEKWYWPIARQNTRKQTWRLPGGDSKPVDVMNFFGIFNYAKFDDGELVEIPYHQFAKGSFYIFLPNEAKLATVGSVSELFNSIPLAKRIEALALIYINMGLPRFEQKRSQDNSGHSIRNQLQALGITTAFEVGRADFSGVDGQRDLYLRDIVQSVALKWNEQSSSVEAAAGGQLDVPTSFVESDEDVVEEHAVGEPFPTASTINLTINHSFLFLIREHKHIDRPVTLFTGVVHDPQP